MTNTTTPATPDGLASELERKLREVDTILGRIPRKADSPLYEAQNRLADAIRLVLRTPSQANDAAGQGEDDTRVLAEAAMAKARDEYHELYGTELKRLREALRPFADYADPREKVPAGCHITPGSYLAKRQLTMGDCYNAARALNTSQGEG